MTIELLKAYMRLGMAIVNLGLVFFGETVMLWGLWHIDKTDHYFLVALLGMGFILLGKD